MGSKYEDLYRENKNALGAPSKVFVKFFKGLAQKNLRVLDVGCGQGRDALFIARLGHEVVGVDNAPSGVADMVNVARAEGLPITGIVADICEWEPEGAFDIVLVDRTLHMLKPDQQVAVSKTLAKAVGAGGMMLIADEKPNLPAIEVAIGVGTAFDVLDREGSTVFLQRKATG